MYIPAMVDQALEGPPNVAVEAVECQRARRIAPEFAPGTGRRSAGRQRGRQLVGLWTVSGSRVRQILAPHRSHGRGAATGLTALAAAPRKPLPVRRARDRRTDRSGEHAAHTVSGRDLPNLD